MGKRVQPELPWDHSSSELFQLRERTLCSEEIGTFKTRLVTAIRNTCSFPRPFTSSQRCSSVGESKPKTSCKQLLLLQPKDTATYAPHLQTPGCHMNYYIHSQLLTKPIREHSRCKPHSPADQRALCEKQPVPHCFLCPAACDPPRPPGLEPAPAGNRWDKYLCKAE